MNPPTSEEAVRDLVTHLPDTVLKRYAAARSVSLEDATKAGEELVKFLVVCSKSEASLSPSKSVDEIWHEFILNTYDYARFCSEVLSGFVHHIPLDSGLDSESVESYHLTRGLIEMEFGKVDPRFWPTSHEVARCSSCGSMCRS